MVPLQQGSAGIRCANLVSFLVTANANLKETIRQYMIQHFGRTLPYVVVWETLSPVI